MSNWSVATWNTLDLFNGDPLDFLKFHISIGADAILLKFGNGQRPWEGLKPFVDIARLQGLKVWGWWFYYGYKNEEIISAEHATSLGLDGFALDIEGQWESRAGLTNKARRKKAENMMKDIKSRFDGELALCSWWHPEGHPKTPIDIFLNYCDWNMPQLYWIGRRSDEGAVYVVKTSLEMYGRLANWPGNKTIPVLASFGQSYWSGGKEYWWKATVTQMRRAYDAAITYGCPGVSWWSLDYLQGRAGHEIPKIVEKKMIETIQSFNQQPPPPSGECPDWFAADIRASADAIGEQVDLLNTLADQVEAA